MAQSALSIKSAHALGSCLTGRQYEHLAPISPYDQVKGYGIFPLISVVSSLKLIVYTRHTMINQDTTFQLRPDVRYRNIHNEGVVVRQGDAEILIINKVAVETMGLLESAKPVHAIVDDLLGKYEVDRQSLESDLDLYLGELLDANVIEELHP